MYKKKSSLLILAVLLFSMVLTGCNADTLGFISHMEEIQTVATTKATQTVSTVSISDIKVPTDVLSDGDAVLMSTVNKYLNNNYISMTQKSDPKKNISYISFDLVEKKTNKKEMLATITYKDEAFALTIGPKCNEIYPGITTMAAPINNKLIPLSTIEELFGDTPIALSALSNPKSLEGLEKKSSAFLKDFLSIYKDADTNLVSKKDGAFVIQLDAKDFIELANTFVPLTLENLDPILSATINFMDSLTDEEFNMIYGTMFPEGKKEIVDMLKEAKLEAAKKENVDELLASWKQVYTEGADEVSTMLAGSSLRVRTWKENNKYYTNLYNVIKVTIPNETDGVFATTILVKEETQVLNDGFDITMPTEEISKEFLESLLSESDIESDI